MRRLLSSLALGTFTVLSGSMVTLAAEHPNIIIICADDLGYGDVSAYGAKAIATPNVDRIAKEGIRFTSGYSTSATCTPSRYSMLTGEYAWRREGTGIATGDAQLIIEPGRQTLASILRDAGYHTGIVGKWHLGLGDGNLDWSTDIKPGPHELGFDESFIMAATGDRVPTVFVKNRRVVGLDPTDPISVSYKTPFPGEPTGKGNPELLTMHPSHQHDQAIVNGISRIGYMKGGKAALWKDEEMSDVFTREAVKFIEKNKSRPFFLFFALHEPHVPRVPHPRFVGKSSLGPRGDAILQMDWAVGEILNTLDRLGLAENTLVIFTNDNGPVLDDGYHDQAVELNGDHKPWGPFRGGKYSRYEAGTRMPWVARWPARIKPGIVSEALISQVDLPATIAALTGQPFDPKTSPDSVNVLPALLGESTTARTELVQQGMRAIALRSGDWKYHEPSDQMTINKDKNIETGNAPEPQLYNLAEDPGERRNLAAENPGKVKELSARLEVIRKSAPQPAVRETPKAQ